MNFKRRKPIAAEVLADTSRFHVDRPIVFFLVWLLVWFYKRWTAVGQSGITSIGPFANTCYFTNFPVFVPTDYGK
jgi:hypothetical protein